MLNMLCCSQCRHGREQLPIKHARDSSSQESTSPNFLEDSLQEPAVGGSTDGAQDSTSSPRETTLDRKSKSEQLREAVHDRLSRQSGASLKVGSKDTAYNIEDGALERPKNLKQTLQDRLQKAPRIGQITSSNEYDADAKFLPTPTASQYQSKVHLESNLDEPRTETESLPKASQGQGSNTLAETNKTVRQPLNKEKDGVCIATQEPNSERLCRTIGGGRSTVPGRLSFELRCSDLQEPAMTIVKNSLARSNAIKRKSLPLLTLQALENAPTCGVEQILEFRKPTSGGSHGGVNIERPNSPLPDNREQQRSSENVPLQANTLASVIIPPKSPSRSVSGSSQSETVRRQLRIASSSSYAGSASFQYTGSFRPPLQLQALEAPKTRKKQEPRKSRFREEFHISMPTSIASLDGNEDKPLGPVSDGHHARAREPGFLPRGDEAATLWERALQTHARETSSHSSRSRSPFRRDMWAASRRNLNPSSPPRSLRSEHRKPPSIESTDIAPDIVLPEPVARPPLRKRPSGTWCRYPSYTRDERTGSAGSGDGVISHDFQSAHDLMRTASMVERNRQKRVPASGSRNVFRIIKDRYVNEGSDLLRLEKGYRSSVSVGGVVKYPDLELLPKMERAYAPSAEKRDPSSNFSNPLSSDESALDDGLSPVSDAPPFPSSARAWSKVYQDCVPPAPFSEAQSEGEHREGDTNEFLSPNYVPRRLSKTKPIRMASSDSMLEVRKSTVDFQQSLRVNEEQSRKSLFQLVDKIGGQEA